MYFMNKISISGGLAVIKNFTTNITVSNWTLSDDTYITEVEHGLSTDNLLISIFKDNISLSMNNVEIINANKIKIYNDTAMNCKVVILAKE